MPSIVLLSGPIASGKTTLAEELIKRHGFQRLRSSDYLKSVCISKGMEVSRTALQQAGDDLDSATDHRWLATEVAAPQVALAPHQKRWLIDSVRKEPQIEHFRAEFGPEVLHVHVWAPENVLRARYDKRRAAGADHDGLTSYSEAVEHPNEIASRALQSHADVAINIDRISPVAASDAIVKLVR